MKRAATLVGSTFFKIHRPVPGSNILDEVERVLYLGDDSPRGAVVMIARAPKIFYLERLTIPDNRVVSRQKKMLIVKALQ